MIKGGVTRKDTINGCQGDHIEEDISKWRFRVMFTANANLYHVIKVPLYLSFTVY